MNGPLNELDIIVASQAAGGQEVVVRFKRAGVGQAVPQEHPAAAVDIDFVALQTDFDQGDFQRYGDRLRDAVLARRPAGGLHWEMMADLSGAPISTRKGLAFSRFLPSERPVRLRPFSSALRALVAVANPSQADQALYRVAPIEFEQQRLKQSMGDMLMTSSRRARYP